MKCTVSTVISCNLTIQTNGITVLLLFHGKVLQWLRVAGVWAVSLLFLYVSQKTSITTKKQHKKNCSPHITLYHQVSTAQSLKDVHLLLFVCTSY